jgi:hypothetical protein
LQARIRKTLITGIVIYISVLGLLYLLHPRIVFQPDKLPPDYTFDFDQKFTELFLPDHQSGSQLHAIHFTVPDTTRGLVLYFHGNADNLQRWGRYMIDFTQHGYEVLAVDYPGYGKSEGKATEENFYRSAELVLDWAKDRFSPEQIIIYGRSLGSGPASWLAARHPARQLILETPFSNITQLLRMQASVALVPFRPQPQFPVDQYIQKVDYPISIFHGTDDGVIPYRVAAQLKPLLKTEDQFITIKGGSHKDLRHFPEYQEQLADLLR